MTREEKPMAGREEPLTFSFLGGPLHQLGRRLGLVRGETNTVLLGLALGGGLWIIICGMALVAGRADQLFSLRLIGGHARLLVVIPLFFTCESWVAPRMAAFVRRIADSGVVPASALPALNTVVARLGRWKDAWWPEAGCLLAAVLVSITGARIQFGESGDYGLAGVAGLAAWVYFRVGLTLFQFLAFRWIWRLGLWIWFLWRVSRLDLHLLPAHPDGAGGLDSVGGIHERFTPLVAAISVLQCAALTEDLSRGAVAISSVYSFLAVLLLVDAAVFLGPLLVFTDKLWASRTRGMGVYMGFAGRYVAEFEEKWLGSGGVPPGQSMLGTPDLQSLADLANSVNIVRNMRWVPIGPRLLTEMTLAALVPLAPLLLFKYPLAELAQRFFARLVGL
jgi:hypothetical protein